MPDDTRSYTSSRSWPFIEHRTMAEVMSAEDPIPAGHSGTGASGMERWEKCLASVSLIRQLDLSDSDEPDYTKYGTAAHDMAAKCLDQQLDTWEVINETFHGVQLSVEDAIHVQHYLDFVRERARVLTAEYGPVEMYVERRLRGAHRSVYGQVDVALVCEGYGEMIDLKFGIGVSVDVEWNKQELYYTHMLQLRHPDVRRWRLYICQPRGHHRDGPDRGWDIDAEDLSLWADQILYPAVEMADAGGGFMPGEHCRFCPLKPVCPALTTLAMAVFEAPVEKISLMDPRQKGLMWGMLDGLEHYIRAFRKSCYQDALNGHKVEGTKLVRGKKNRVWRDGAQDALLEKLGTRIFTEPVLRSPSQMEAFDKELVKQWAYSPEGELTLVAESDGRAEVIPQTNQQVFAKALDNMLRIE